MRLLKKLLSVVSATAMVFSMSACSNSDSSTTTATSGATSETASGAASGAATDKDLSDIKFGLICLHDENSTYDLNFINAMNDAKANLGLDDSQVIIKTNVPESNDCYEAALDLIDRGCNIIFADSFGHESFVLQAAKENPDVQFCHATGTNAHTEQLKNFSNAFASIYEGRYLAGVAAGMKLNEMIKNGDFTEDEALIGYVGAYTYAEVISGYTSFYLGAKSICPTVEMKVQFTGSWYDETAEKEAANALINAGCKLISQHADSMGAPTACETANVPNVSYNGSTESACPNTFIVSSKIDWAPYFEYVVNCVADKKSVDADWIGTISSGSVKLSDINTKAAAEGTVEKIEEVKKSLENGSIHVFDTKTFTVEGKELTSYLADVDTDAAYEKDTEVISDGYFHESEKRSAPYFDIQIDGIELLNSEF